MFHLRRSQFLQVFNNSPDETAYYRWVVSMWRRSLLGQNLQGKLSFKGVRFCLQLSWGDWSVPVSYRVANSLCPTWKEQDKEAEQLLFEALNRVFKDAPQTVSHTTEMWRDWQTNPSLTLFVFFTDTYWTAKMLLTRWLWFNLSCTRTPSRDHLRFVQ